jgi:hypothetical protein
MLSHFNSVLMDFIAIDEIKKTSPHFFDQLQEQKNISMSEAAKLILEEFKNRSQ